MMQLTKSLVVVAALIGVLTESAMASIEPYVGMGYEWSTINHRRGNSHGSIFNKYFGGGNVYAGARWKDISLEAGHESTGNKYKSGSYSAMSKDSELVTASFRTPNSFTGWHIDLNAHMPVIKDFELLGSLGYGVIKHRSSSEFSFSVSGGSVLSENLHISNKYKNTFRLGLGIQQMFCNHIGIRCMIRYKLLNNHSRLKSDLFEINESVKFKNIVSVAAGVIFKF
jgi:hypothetical protein